MTDVMTDNAIADEEVTTSSGGGTEKVGKLDAQIDLLMDGIDNLDSKKSQVRITALNNIVDSLRSGADLFDRVQANMDAMIGHLKRFLSQRSAVYEAILAMKVVNIVALVAGADSDEFANEFNDLLITLATKSEVEEVDLRVAAVRTLAFVHLVCCGGQGGFSCFGIIGDIALLQSEGTDACPDVQIAAAESWCLLAQLVDPQKVCDVSREEDMFVELVTLLGNPNTEIKISAAQCLALLWEVADKLMPGVDATVSADLMCDDEDKVREALTILQQIGKESSKRVKKKDRKERKSALKSVTEWILEGNPPEEDAVRLQGGDAELNSFGEIRLMDALRRVLKGGLQSCLRVYPVTREMLGVEYVSFDDLNGDHSSGTVAAGMDMSCDAFDKRFVRSQVGKIKTNHRRNQRADKEMLQAECF